MSRFLFPRWSNSLIPVLLVVGGVAPIYVAFLVAYGFSPKSLEVGYQPVQPVAFSHAMHAGQLGLDCRYCHSTVDRASFAAVPATQVCMNCHTQIRKDSPKLAEVRKSYETGSAIPWVEVHKLPDYAYFDHSAHVNRGVSCVECHGRIDTMEQVTRVAELSMGWCLNCHRDPVDKLRPVSKITTLWWDQKTEMTQPERESLVQLYHISPSENCSTCHR